LYYGLTLKQELKFTTRISTVTPIVTKFIEIRFIEREN